MLFLAPCIFEMGKERKDRRKPKRDKVTGVPTPEDTQKILEQLPQTLPVIQKVGADCYILKFCAYVFSLLVRMQLIVS